MDIRETNGHPHLRGAPGEKERSTQRHESEERVHSASVMFFHGSTALGDNGVRRCALDCSMQAQAVCQQSEGLPPPKKKKSPTPFPTTNTHCGAPFLEALEEE